MLGGEVASTIYTHREAKTNCITNLSLIDIDMLLCSRPGVKVIIKHQNGDDYWRFITWMLDFNRGYANHGQTTTETGKEHVEGVVKDMNLRRTTLKIHTLRNSYTPQMVCEQHVS